MDSICIVIPFYNEAGRFPVEEFRGFLERSAGISFCLVNDGSTDETKKVLESLRGQYPERILVCTMPVNKGKAEAVRTGMLAGLSHFTPGYIGYFDADLSAPLEEAFRLKDKLNEKPGLKFAFGSRVAIVGAHIERKLYRHLVGRVIATFIANILGLMVYDTQCGAKLFERSLVPVVFEEPFISKWLFDAEIIARIIRISGKEEAEKVMVEVPLNSWTDRGKSKIRWTYGFKVFYDLFRIYRIYHT